VPVAVLPTKFTEQVPVADRMQLGALRVPPVVPGNDVKETEPVGILAGFGVSATVAVQTDVWSTTVVPGLHETTVDVASIGGGP